MARARRPRAPLPRFAVAWFPRFEGIDRIEAIRRRHDPAASLIPAHLSLVFPFPTSLTRLQVSTHVRNVVSRWPPIPVTFRRVRLHGGEFAAEERIELTNVLFGNVGHRLNLLWFASGRATGVPSGGGTYKVAKKGRFRISR